MEKEITNFTSIEDVADIIINIIDDLLEDNNVPIEIKCEVLQLVKMTEKRINKIKESSDK